MKKFFILIPALCLSLFSCSPSDSDNDTETDTETDPEFAMTAKINGDVFQANNPFGNNEFSDYTVWNYYPPEDFILLQARLMSQFAVTEINLWLKKSDIAVGIYEIGEETFEVKPSHYVSLIESSNSESESTKEGTIVITEVNTSTKIVKGTFEFTTVADLWDPTVNFRITEGTFWYTYE